MLVSYPLLQLPGKSGIVQFFFTLCHEVD